MNDDQRMGDFFFHVGTYKIFQEGLRALIQKIDAIHESVAEFDLEKKPYEEERKRLRQMVEWGSKQLQGKSDFDEIFIQGISAGSLRRLKAAALIKAAEYEAKKRDLQANQNVAPTVIEAINVKIKEVIEKSKIGVLGKVEPAEIYSEVMTIEAAKTKPLGTDVVFISYETSEIDLAFFIDALLKARSEQIKPFIAKRDIAAGSEPFQVMLRDHLLKARSIISICTAQSKNSRWIWWESSAVWASGGKVFPIYAKITPEEFGEPLKTLFQGKKLFDSEDLESMLGALFAHHKIKPKFLKLTSQEVEKLKSLSTFTAEEKHYSCRIKSILKREEYGLKISALQFGVTNLSGAQFKNVDLELNLPANRLIRNFNYPHLSSRRIADEMTQLFFSYSNLSEVAKGHFRNNLFPKNELMVFGESGITNLEYKETGEELTVFWRLFIDGHLAGESKETIPPLS